MRARALCAAISAPIAPEWPRGPDRLAVAVVVGQRAHKALPALSAGRTQGSRHTHDPRAGAGARRDRRPQGSGPTPTRNGAPFLGRVGGIPRPTTEGALCHWGPGLRLQAPMGVRRGTLPHLCVGIRYPNWGTSPTDVHSLGFGPPTGRVRPNSASSTSDFGAMFHGRARLDNAGGSVWRSKPGFVISTHVRCWPTPPSDLRASLPTWRCPS